MVTVDDLVISLTIKETSKLGQLQKQLEAIVGKRGEKAPIVGLDPSLKTDLNYIKQRINYLMPTEIPGTGKPKAMALAAKTASDLIDRNMKKYAEKLTPTREGNVKSFAKALGIKEEDLGEFLEGKLEDWQYRLEEIMSGTWSTPSAQKFLVRINDLISRKEMDIGQRKMVFESIENSISEFNVEVAQLLEKLGIFAIPEFSMFKMTDEVLKAIGDPNGQLRLSMADLQKQAGITGNKEAEDAYKKIRNIANMPNLTDPLKFIEQAFKSLGISKADIKKKMFTKAGVMADPRLKAMIPSIIQVAARKGEVTGIPKGFAQAIKDVVVDMFKSPITGENNFEQFYQNVRPDLLVISDELEKLKDIFGEDIAEKITKGFFEFSEFKKILSQQNADQFVKYQGYVGDRLFGLSSSIQESFGRYVPDVLTKTINIMQELAKAGSVQKLTEVEKVKIVEEAQKSLSNETLKLTLEKILEVITDSDERAKIIEKIIKQKDTQIAGGL